MRFLLREIFLDVKFWVHPATRSSQNFVVTRKVLRPPIIFERLKKGLKCHHGFGTTAQGECDQTRTENNVTRYTEKNRKKKSSATAERKDKNKTNARALDSHHVHLCGVPHNDVEVLLVRRADVHVVCVIANAATSDRRATTTENVAPPQHHVHPHAQSHC